MDSRSAASATIRRFKRCWATSRPLDLWPRCRSSETEAQQRRIRLLTVVLAALILLTLAAAVVVVADNPAGSLRRSGYLVLVFSMLFALVAALVLNGSGHFRWAASLVVLSAVAGPWGSVLLDPLIVAGDFVPLTYAVVPVLLSGILLSAGITALVAGVQIALLLVFSVAVPNHVSINWPSLLTMVFFVSVLSIVGNLMIARDLRQIVRQNRRLEESEALLREQSVRDHVSGLFNRRYLEETLQRELERAKRGATALAVIMIDIDHFKRLNDTFGHAAGDIVLRELGNLIGTNLRGIDMVCRYGGDEITVVMPDTDRDVALERAERIRKEAGKLRIDADGEVIPGPTLSLGVAVYPRDGLTGPELLAAGDAALYLAKDEGRDRVRQAAPRLVGGAATEPA